MVADDRGQLLLLGGLAIAIVFLAAIPLSNSLVVTESAASSETVHEIDRTADRAAGIERDIRTLANRTDAVNNTDAFNASLRNYSRYRVQVSGQQSAVYVNASINVTASGQAANSSDFREPVTDNRDWALVNRSDRTEAFTITVENDDGNEFGPRPGASPSANSPFRITVSNSSGDEWRLRLVNPSGSSDDVAVDVRPPGGTWNDGVCRGQFYTIDVQAGTCTTGGTFSSYSDTLAAPYNISYNRGDRVGDSYWNLTASGDFDDGLDTSIGTPYVDMSYVGPETSYDRIISISGGGASSSSSTPPSPSLPDGAVFTGTGSGILNITGDDSATSTISTSETPTGLGPASDVDSDGTIEVPYVDSSGNIRLVTSSGSETLVADNSDIDNDVDTDKTRLAVGTWNGSGQSVFFANDSSPRAIYRVDPGSSPVVVATPPNGVNSVVGPADIDGDDTDELVFADGSQTLRYLEDDGSTNTIPNSGGVSLGSSTGIGSGAVADYDGDGSEEVAAVDGGNDIVLADASGSDTVTTGDVDGTSAPSASQSPPTAADVDGDDSPELVYIADSDGNLNYLDNIDGSGDIFIRDLTDDGGNAISGDRETGVT